MRCRVASSGGQCRGHAKRDRQSTKREKRSAPLSGRGCLLGQDARVVLRTYLTAVVAAELYAGTHDRREKRALDELCHAHHALGHFLSPAAVWIDAGILLWRVRRASDRMDFVHHFRDLLIVLEAARVGATLVTESFADFARWRSLLASAGQNSETFQPISVEEGTMESP